MGSAASTSAPVPINSCGTHLCHLCWFCTTCSVFGAIVDTFVPRDEGVVVPVLAGVPLLWPAFSVQCGPGECGKTSPGPSIIHSIPLEDLPELQVGFGFGLVDKDKLPPKYLKDIKLITHKNKHRFVAPGGVKQLTKEEFEAFNSAP